MATEKFGQHSPLRHRREDIPPLANPFARTLCEENGRSSFPSLDTRDWEPITHQVVCAKRKRDRADGRTGLQFENCQTLGSSESLASTEQRLNTEYSSDV